MVPSAPMRVIAPCFGVPLMLALLACHHQVAATTQREVQEARPEATDDITFDGEAARGLIKWARSASSHLRAYLPSGTPVRGKVLFALFIPAYAFAWGDGSIVINVTAGFWGGNPDKVFNLLVHELYHNGFGLHRHGSSPQDAKTGAALVENLLWQTQHEGMATYVAYRARPPGLLVEDYAFLDDAAEVRVRFKLLQKLLDDMGHAGDSELAPLRERLWSGGTSKRAFYVVGAWMARDIEARHGRDALIRTVVDGPRAFLDAYMSSSPQADLQLRLPPAHTAQRAVR